MGSIENLYKYTEEEIITSISIPKNIHDDIKNRHWKLKDLLISGYYARKDEPIWKERVRVLEEKLAKVTEKLHEFTKKSWELEEKLQNLEKR